MRGTAATRDRPRLPWPLLCCFLCHVCGVSMTRVEQTRNLFCDHSPILLLTIDGLQFEQKEDPAGAKSLSQHS